jgi:hypothetical protein
MNSLEVCEGVARVFQGVNVSAEVAIICGSEIGLSAGRQFISIGAKSPIEIDKIQAVMAMVGYPFVKWVSDEHGEFMIYEFPEKLP